MNTEIAKLAKTRCTDCVHFKVSCFISRGYWCEACMKEKKEDENE